MYAYLKRVRGNLSEPYICPKCRRNYSAEERSKNKFCLKCEIHLIPWTHAKGLLVHPIEKAMKNKESFVKQIYSNVMAQKNSPITECDRCFKIYQFSELEDFPHKPCFPPIGSSDFEQVLFIGTNPRCRQGTKDEFFYRHALSSSENFLHFSNDGIYEDREGSLKPLFDDPHYRIHQECLAKVDPSWELGQKSSVAELFMCCSEDTNIFSDAPEYICAEEYLIKYMELVKPRVIVSFGLLTMKWFQARFANELEKNMRFLDNGVPRKHNGYPTKDSITKLHGHFSEISLKAKHVSTLILSLHPSKRLDYNKQKELFKSFCFVAKNVGF